MSDPTRSRRLLWLHLLLIGLTSAVYESLFVGHSLNLMDEGWPLYAAMRLHAGGTLYDSVFFVFPPGHVLPAWLAYGLDPPGVVLSRVIYAGFAVALCLALYLFGRRIMPPGYAFFGVLLLCVAGSSAHRYQLIFGYRYLVFAVLALLSFARRVDTGDRRFTVLSGACAGVALAFRLTPAFAVSCGIAAGLLALDRSPRVFLREGLLYMGGLLLVVAPLVAWFAASVGLDTLWREVVVRPVVMTNLQSLPMPPLDWWPPSGGRRKVMRWFVGVQYRMYLLLYAGYAGVLAVRWLRALVRRTSPPSPLLIAFVVFGGIYFVRTLGRSDAPHLYSAIPPVCLLLGHFASITWRDTRGRLVAGTAVFALWVYLMGSERFLFAEQRGQVPLRSLDGRVGLNTTDFSGSVDRTVAAIRRYTRPGETILDLSSAPLLHVLAERPGVGYTDLLMPGTFLDGAEESAFLERLRRDPPALVIWPDRSFDKRAERNVVRTAPRVVAWVTRHYRFEGAPQPGDRFRIMLPRRPHPGREPVRAAPR